MSKRSKLIVSKLAAAIVIILIFVISFGLSWIVTCGVIKLITMCFGLTFKWSIATGIWLILCLLHTRHTEPCTWRSCHSSRWHPYIYYP